MAGRPRDGCDVRTLRRAHEWRPHRVPLRTLWRILSVWDERRANSAAIRDLGSEPSRCGRGDATNLAQPVPPDRPREVRVAFSFFSRTPRTVRHPRSSGLVTGARIGPG